jgi:maleate isomerase
MGRLRLGMIIPSSNTVVEEVCCAMLAGVPAVSTHFARFKLTRVSVADPAAEYYDSGLLLEAGKLLADARCDVITWNGSAGGLVGFDLDRKLCRDIQAETGIPATTSSLSLIDAFRETGVRRFAMVTLNPPAMNETIVRNFRAEGYECIATTHRSDLADNFAMAEVDAAEIGRMIADCAVAKPDAITVFGTNTRGASVADRSERELGIPVYDTVALGIWGAMRRAGADTTAVRGWGGLFQLRELVR